MTMSSPQCRNHGLSGACSNLPPERQPLCGLARKQTHQSGCLLNLFRHAFMNEGLAALHARSQSFSPSRKPNSSPPKSHRIRSVTSDSLRSSHTRCRLPALALLWQPACRVPSSYPRRRHYSSAARHLHTMEVSTIPGESHPGLGSAGSINAVPSAGRARHSLGLVIPAHKPHEPSWLPRYAKVRPVFHGTSALRMMLAASLDEPH